MMPTPPDRPRPVLSLPPGIQSGRDPLRAGLAGSLTDLSEALKRHGLPGAAWAFRETVDLVTVFLAAAAVVPLSPGEAPLPGWRRGLWRSDYADMAPGLLNWAASYLPKRSRQNALAGRLLDLLFEDGHRHLAGTPRPFAGLLGVGDPATAGPGGWLEWREAFFSLEDPAEIRAASEGLASHLESLEALLPALDGFLAAWSFGTVLRGETARLSMRDGDETSELPPFLIVRECETCGWKDSLFVLAAPTAGDRYLYREARTGHLAPVPADAGFQRRFFSGGSSPGRTGSHRASGLERSRPLAAARPPLEAEADLAAALTPAVLGRHHLPVLMVVAAAGEPVPLELLADPALGCRDAIAAAARLAGLVTFLDEGVVEPASTGLADELRALHPAEATEASRRLALWAEAQVQEPGGAGTLGGRPGRGLARWALAGGDAPQRVRLSTSPAVRDEILRWLEQEEREGRGVTALQASDDWLRLLGGAPAEAALFLARLRASRGAWRRRAGDPASAREELGRALDLVPATPEGERLRARALTDRARVYLDLAQPGKAAEDGSLAADVWSRVAAAAPEDRAAQHALAEVACLRGRALVALGQRRQASALMQRAADKGGTPETPEELFTWIGLYVDLGELLRGLGDIPGSEARFRSALELLARAPEGPRVQEATALALRGAARGRDVAGASEFLGRARDILEELVAAQGRLDLQPTLAEVLDDLASTLQEAGRPEEALEAAAAAGTVFEDMVRTRGRADLRAVWARVSWRRGLQARALARVDEADAALTRALELFAQLVGEGQARLGRELAEVQAERGGLRFDQERWEEARADLDAAIRHWPEPTETGAPVPGLVRALGYRARIHRQSGAAEAALRDYDRALELGGEAADPSLAAGMSRDRARLLLAAGLPERAEEDLTAVLARSGDEDPEALASLRLARAVARMRVGRLEEALDDFLAAEQHPAEHLRAMAGRGLAHLRLGHLDLAVQAFRKVLEEGAERPAEEVRVEFTLSHGGLAGVREAVGAGDQARGEWASASRSWTPEGAAPGLLAWEVGQVLSLAGQVHLDHSDAGLALPDLLAARDLMAEPAVQGDPARLNRLRVRGAVAKALIALARDREAVAEARAALEVPDDVALQEIELSAELHLFCGQALTTAGAWGETARNHLDRAVSLLERLLEESGDAGAQGALALACLLRGSARAVARQFDGSLEDLDRAHALIGDLRSRMDGHGLEWELGLTLVRRAEVRVVGDEAEAAQADLVAAAAVVPEAPAPRPGYAWVRAHLLEALAGFPATRPACTAASCRALGDLASLEAWSWPERHRLEGAWCAFLRGGTGDQVFPTLTHVARSLGVRATPPGEPVGGALLVEAWLERGLELASSGDPAAMPALRTLADLTAGGGPWSSLASPALQGLAGLWESRGEPQRALQLLDEARSALAGDEPSRTIRGAWIRVDRARVLETLGEEVGARQDLEKAEAALEEQDPAAVPERLRKEIARVRGMLDGTHALPEEPEAEAPPAAPPAPVPAVAAPVVPAPAPAPAPAVAAPEAASPAPGATAPEEAPQVAAEASPEAPAAAARPEEGVGLASAESGEAAIPTRQPGGAWEAVVALEQVDRALEALDGGDLDLAERLLLEAGHDLPRSTDPDLMEILPALLEGLLGLAEALLERGWSPHALAIAEYGGHLGQDHLAACFDPEAWPWWGDLLFLAGRLQQLRGNLDRASDSLLRARETFLELVHRGSEEAMLDALRVMVARAGALQDQGDLEGAEREFSAAVEVGRDALESGLPEEAAVARVHMGRGRLRIHLGRLEEALPDYEWALDLYARVEEEGALLAELGASRVGLAEILTLLGRQEEAATYRAAAEQALAELRRGGEEELAAHLQELLAGLASLRPEA